MSNLSFASNTDGITSLYEFVGVQVGATDYDGVTAPTVGVKYGQQNRLWRTAISYNFSQNSDDTFHSLIVQVDRGVLTELFVEYPFKPYVGFSLGVLQHDNSHHRISPDRGYLYGLNGGINYVLNNELDVDFGYRYLRTDQLEYIDEISNFTLSLHYYFD